MNRGLGGFCAIFAWRLRASPWRKRGRSRRSWLRMSSATAGSPGRTRIARLRGLRGLRSDLIDPAIAAHHGRIVKRTGDGSIVEFRSVVDAVRCAIEVQNGMVERNAGVPPERRIEFRIGIHLGDVVEEADGDLMGDGVNIAARLEGICEPGAICLSEDAYRQVKGRLDLAVSDLGPTQLKNIAEPIRVYSLASRQAGAGEARDAADEAARAEKALAARAARRRDRRAGHRRRGRRLVFPRRQSIRDRRDQAGARGGAPFHRGAALRQSLRRSGAGLPRRRPDRPIDHRYRAPPRQLRDRAQHSSYLQGQAGRRQDHRQGVGRALCAGGLGATDRQSGEGQRPAHRRRKRRPPVGRTVRHAPRRSVADAGRDRHPSGALDVPSTARGRGRASQTHACGKSRRRGFGSPVPGGLPEKRSYLSRNLLPSV